MTALHAPTLPPLFKEKFSSLLGKESGAFFSSLQTKSPKCLWTNDLLTTPAKLRAQLEEDGWKLKQLPFHTNAFCIKEGPSRPGQHPLFRTGHFNLQDAAAMLPAILLTPKPGARVLDATAAPGTKTLQMACLMQGKGELVALEKSKARLKSLRFNVRKHGMKNTRVRHGDLLKARVAVPFDAILLDAPCSGEGMARKKPEALASWTPGLVARKAAMQKKLITHAFSLLKPGGRLVYSVCALSPEEGEEVVQHLLQKHATAKLMPDKALGLKTRGPLSGYPGLKHVLRLWPQDNDTQGFFMALIARKQGGQAG